MKQPLQRIHCMPPLIDEKSRILIVGTMPGPESLAQQVYYANSRNHFWDFMSRILQPDYPPYQIFDHQTPRRTRYQLLQNHGIALWDVVAECYRKSSSDKDIQEAIFNDIAELVDNYPISHIFSNGKNALKFLATTGQLKKLQKLTIVELPSTSTKNPLNTFAVLHQWKTELHAIIPPTQTAMANQHR